MDLDLGYNYFISILFLIFSNIADVTSILCTSYYSVGGYKYCSYSCCGYSYSRYCCYAYNYYYTASTVVSVGAIVGGVIGGLIGLAVTIAVVIIICKAVTRRPVRGTVVAPMTQTHPHVAVVSTTNTIQPPYYAPPPAQGGYMNAYASPQNPAYPPPGSVYPPPASVYPPPQNTPIQPPMYTDNQNIPPPPQYHPAHSPNVPPPAYGNPQTFSN